MKKTFIFILMFCLALMNVSADESPEEYTCSYDFTYHTSFDWFEKNKTLVFTVNTKNKTITESGGFFDKPLYFMDYYVSEKYTNAYIVESLNGGCVNNIIVGPLEFDSIYGYAVFFEESNFFSLETAPIGFALPSKFIEDLKMLGGITEYAEGVLNEEKSTGKKTQGVFGCEFYDNTMEKLKKINLDDFSQINEYNTMKESLKSFCKNVLKSANIGTSYCIDPCLGLTEELATIEKKGDINNNNCGFSERLLVWIRNILRWVKYLLPVAVIVLGILDFIKAIGADKDDEMKKAQGKFVKRLIAAALVFIIPLIIEFVLGKMGFGYNACGLF